MAALYTIGRDPHTGQVAFALIADEDGAQFLGVTPRSTVAFNGHVDTMKGVVAELPETAIDWLALALSNLQVTTSQPMRALNMKDGIKRAKIALDATDDDSRRPQSIRERLAAEADAIDELFDIFPDMDPGNMTPEQELERDLILAGGINIENEHTFYPEEVGSDTCAFCELQINDPIHDEAA